MSTTARRPTMIILSDLHIGAGYANRGNRLEDFTKDAELVVLIDQLKAESERRDLPMELVLNGDNFEFWQVPALEDATEFDPSDRYPVRFYLRTREIDSARRMRLIVSGHRPLFEALAGFLQAGAPRRAISIIKGNHDVQLHWPAVQAVIREALGACDGRTDLVSFPPRSLSRDGVYIEHGSEYADALNRHPSFEDPRHPRRPDRLRMVPGAAMSIRILNRMAREHYWITSVKPTSAIFWYLLRFDPLTALRMLILALPHLPRWLWLHRPMTRSNPQLVRDLQSLEDETHPSQEADGDPRLPSCFGGYDGEVGLVNLPSLTKVLDEERAGDDPLLIRGLLEEHHLHARLRQVAQLKVLQEQACAVIFGHTHLPAAEMLDGGAVYLNTGSWTWMLDLREQPAEAWRRLIRHEDHDDVHYHLTYARIDYGEDGLPRASLHEHS